MSAIKVGVIESLFRYPVKSMGGERLEAAELGWHGLAGDRRLAFRRTEERGGFPWLSASKLPELILYAPQPNGSAPPTHVRTPEGKTLETFSPELAADVSRRFGSPVEMMYLDRGIFDEASVSVITAATIGEIERLVSRKADVRRYRPNILVASTRSTAFEEDDWVGGVLSFGDDSDAAVAITMRDERCSMVNFDPETARPAPEILKAIVQIRENKAGVYASVFRRGRLAVGQTVYFDRGP